MPAPVTWRCLPALVAAALLQCRVAAEASWSSCGGAAANATAVRSPREALTLHGVHRLAACKALCEKEASCSGVSYLAAAGSCELSKEPTGPSLGADGSECQRLAREAPERFGAPLASHSHKVPRVFVMLPLTTVGSDGLLTHPTGLKLMLEEMKGAGVDGFMVDVWWGITEPSPMHYRFDGYHQLVDLAKEVGLKMQCVTSFHQCGGNHGDDCWIPLPSFVRNADGIWYRDSHGTDTREYISLFADGVQVAGRTPLQMYTDWFSAFAEAFSSELGDTIVEIMVGMGPSGELRYPSYRLPTWRFCGIGEFQAYDPHALASLRTAAAQKGHAKDWGLPPNSSVVGTYNSFPSSTSFFTRDFATAYGKFFLEWYSGALKAHAVELLSRARRVFGNNVRLSGKISGIHWWYATDSHAAEVTAGYYNTNFRNAYAELADVFKLSNTTLDFTCLEMRNHEQPSECKSRPENLVHQVLLAAKEKAISVSGENALPRYDNWAYSQLLSYKGDLEAFTYLRLGKTLLEPANLARFRRFVSMMREGDIRRRLEEAGGDSGEDAGADEEPADSTVLI